MVWLEAGKWLIQENHTCSLRQHPNLSASERRIILSTNETRKQTWVFTYQSTDSTQGGNPARRLLTNWRSTWCVRLGRCCQSPESRRQSQQAKAKVQKYRGEPSKIIARGVVKFFSRLMLYIFLLEQLNSGGGRRMSHIKIRCGCGHPGA